jgi:hypothetical protein
MRFEEGRENNMCGSNCTGTVSEVKVRAEKMNPV